MKAASKFKQLSEKRETLKGFIRPHLNFAYRLSVTPICYCNLIREILLATTPKVGQVETRETWKGLPDLIRS